MNDSRESRKGAISEEQRARAVELVEMIRSSFYSDEENAALTAELKSLIPHPAWDDLLFWQTPELSDEEAVDEALKYRPIEL